MKRKTKETLLTILVIIILGVVMCTAIYFCKPKELDKNDYCIVEMVARPGDTVWEYAEEFGKPDMSKEDYCDYFLKLNKTTELKAGKIYRVPVYSAESRG